MDIEDINNNKAQEQPNNPTHGVKLMDMLEFLVAIYGWEELEARSGIRAFGKNPTFKSALKFLRKTPWAREKIERMFYYFRKKLKG